ncbi:MAG: hypothetical protein K2W82_15520 [Candidatus Obscuribacterales bacterium]|nr:hypothetical protein [Candidatus Obscuribacterales bacterium]
MDTILQLWPVWTLLALGLALFLFNINQATSGYHSMRNLDQRRKEQQARLLEYRKLIQELGALKRQFQTKTSSLSETERLELWRPVDKSLMKVFSHVMAGSHTTAHDQLLETVAQAKELLDKLS